MEKLETISPDDDLSCGQTKARTMATNFLHYSGL